ncbi:MAG: hypothetical protein V9E88_14375 [Ferruginibacter sp.]
MMIMAMNFDEEGGFMYSWRSGGADDEPYVNTAEWFHQEYQCRIAIQQ